MDEYQHMERFSMENEFSDGQWVGGEFFYRKRKEKHNQTKEEALYGFWEESDSDEDSVKRRRRGDVMKKSDLTKPVSFVSTGAFNPLQEMERKTEENGDGEMARMGFETGSGLGFRASEGTKVEEEEELLPTAFGKRIVEAAERKEKEREKAKLSAKIRGSNSGTGVPDIAVFEKHTRGIGMKLLEKMGYKGGGLGKNQQGIAAPIEARLRPNKMGMGFNDFRETNTGLPPAPGENDIEGKLNESKPKVKERLWLKKNRGRKKDYVTASELLIQKQAQGIETVQTILDMRGPQVRVLTNLESLNAEHVARQENTPMPELQHNMRLIVDLAEAEIQTCDRKLALERDSVIVLEKERERLQNEERNRKSQIDIVQDILASIRTLQEKAAAGGVSLQAIASAFAGLNFQYREEYKLYNLGVIALSYALPLMVGLFRGWEPLQQPHHGVEVMSAWQGLLQGDNPQDYSVFPESDGVFGASSSAYTQLVMEAIMPAIRIAATNFWEPRDPEPMLRFLESWEKLLPTGVLQNILDHLVMPKLTVAVDAWDPRQETVPIHAWLHPWLPLLGSRMEPLYLPIRFKLAAALQAWYPSDVSAYTLLSPWQAVFDAGSWEQLLVRSIVPKLMYALQELVVNPAHQQLDQFNWVMAWATAVPMHHMAGMLEVGFFPKWQQVLYHWLCQNPNFDEVTQWYLGWKSLFPPELLANERIRRQLNVALDMMNQAVEGTPVVQPGARENVSYLRVTEQRQFESQQQAAYSQQQHQHTTASSMHIASSAVDNLSLKEVLEAFAQDNDVQFVPKLSRMHEGLQVYGFGTVNVCVDSAKQVVLVQTNDRWIPVSLDQLLEMHRSRSGSRWK